MAGGSNVARNLNKWAQNKRMALEALARTTASNMEAYARPNAPWTDQTGMARRGLSGGSYWDGDGIFSYIAHSVSYGKYLEKKGDGPYSILIPTRDKFANTAFKQAERIMNL